MEDGRDQGPKRTPRNGTLDEILVDWDEFRATRTQLGAAFVRILGYFREDGPKSVAAIEEASRARDARGLVIPAQTRKRDARQSGGAKNGRAPSREKVCQSVLSTVADGAIKKKHS